MSMRQVNDLSKLYVEAVYGGVKKKEDPKDTRMVVTNADKKANTPAYKKFKAGDKAYKAADHMEEGHSADTKGKKNCGCGQDPCITYGKQDKSMKEEKKAAKDYDGDGKIESGKDEYFGSKDKAIKKAMGKKVKQQEQYSNWRDELVEDNLIEVVDSDEEDENYGAKKKIDVKKGIKNKVNINPNLPEAVQEMGAELIEVKVEKKKGKAEFSSKAKGHDCASKVKHESYGVGDCIKEQHDLDENGNVTHYDVKFSNRIVRNVPASTLEVLEGMYHEHVIREKESYDTVAAVIDYDRSKKGTDDAVKDSEEGKKKAAKKERDYAAFERKKMKKDDPNWEHKRGSTSENYQAMRNPEKAEKEDKRSAREKRMADPKKGINSPAFKEFMRQQGM
jgi:hypothetical protein|tara:strand:+ start:3232 stop:4404 length:1173 start_codon:yes stop_codon:yes gene_type:complete